DINVSTVNGCSPNSGGNCFSSPDPLAWNFGVLQDKDNPTCYILNAAIAWKQPNGFYYPPAFHSTNLFFNNVDIRHYVVQPLYQPGTYLTNDARVQSEFIGIDTAQTGLMTGFTDIDRQTVLNDDDGTLTGFSKTISVNEDAFFG